MIEAFYTSGGIWIAQTYLDEHNMTYAVVSSEAPEYLTISIREKSWKTDGKHLSYFYHLKLYWKTIIWKKF